MQKGILLVLFLALLAPLPWAQPTEVQFVFTSDSHYGIQRSSFRGRANVDAHTVNAALVAEMNRLETATFPRDGGIRSTEPVGPIDFVVDAGDIANRSEIVDDVPIQSAATSWEQFRMDYVAGLNLLDRSGKRAPLYVVPGNHDASNAVGYFKPMRPAVDKSSMAAIYNLMMNPVEPRTPAAYDYSRDKVLVSHDVDGIHFVFLTIWPDSKAREWLSQDLQRVSASTPVIIFAHDQPDSQAKQFINPNGNHDLNDRDMFENILSDTLADKFESLDAQPLIEQTALETFIRQHPNITAYFHGNSNWNQFYDWTGPNHSVALHTFRVDSPMKGNISAMDETKLSFQIATIDSTSRTMTVREVLWNTHPSDPAMPLTFGSSTTVALFPRPTQ